MRRLQAQPKIENAELDALLRAFSPGRMEPYVRFSGGLLESLSGAMHGTWRCPLRFAGPLHCLEIVLRNAMHRSLSAYFGQENLVRPLRRRRRVCAGNADPSF